MLFYKEPAHAEAAVLLTSNIGKELSEKSQALYLESSVRPVGKDGNKIIDNVLNGFFVTPEIKWAKVVEKLKKISANYNEKPDPSGKLMENRLGLSNVFPPITVERDFSKDALNDPFCKAEIKFTPRLMSKSDTIKHIYSIKENANETDDWVAGLIKWLNDQKMPGFYNVIEFKIIGTFDFDMYYNAKVKEIKIETKKIVAAYKRQIDNKGREKIVVENAQKDKDKAKEGIEKQAAELAQWAVEYVTKEQVFEDLCTAFDAACKADTVVKEGTPKPEVILGYQNLGSSFQDKKGTTEIPPENDSSPKSRILTYTPLTLKLTVEVYGPKPNAKISLADEVKATIRVENYSTQKFKIDKNFKIVTESKYFEEETITFEDPSNHAEFQDWTPLETKNKNGDDAPKSFVKTEKILKPKINEITAEDLESYPIVFNLKQSDVGTPQKKENEEILLTPRDIQIAKSKQNVVFTLPKVKFSVTRPYLPFKGEQFEVTFKVNIGSSAPEKKIPFRIDCHCGKDFTPMKSLPADETKTSESRDIKVIKEKKATEETNGTDKKDETIAKTDKPSKSEEPAKESVVTPNEPTKKEVPTEEEQNKKQEDNTITFQLMANRASFPGYYDIANFEMFIGKRQIPSETWKMKMTVLPNLLDTIIAGGTFILGTFALARPDIIPGLTEGLNVANLGAIPAIAYLGYRVLNWSKNTGAFSSSSS